MLHRPPQGGAPAEGPAAVRGRDAASQLDAAHVAQRCARRLPIARGAGRARGSSGTAATSRRTSFPIVSWSRAWAWRSRIECPPRSKKLSCMLTCSTWNSSCQTSAIVRVDLVGGSHIAPWRRAPPPWRLTRQPRVDGGSSRLGIGDRLSVGSIRDGRPSTRRQAVEHHRRASRGRSDRRRPSNRRPISEPGVTASVKG